MALHVTQCPRCESTFNTSARILEAAHGLVRCGACLSIFEADQHVINPLPDASNDENGAPSVESVFISAPEEYFDPAEFLNHGESSEEDGFDQDEGELLYAKSDIHDSSFDVFDVDPEPEDSKVHEQVLDSDFDVFDVSDVKKAQQQAEPDIQDNEFDIYDAGERVIRARSRPDHEVGPAASASPKDARHEQYQLKASFSFSTAIPQTLFAPQPGIATVPPQPQPEAPPADDTIAPEPPGSADDAVVILPEGPDAAVLLQALQPEHDAEIILPPGPDAAVLLDELMTAGGQAEIDQSRQDPEPDDYDTGVDEPAFLPDEGRPGTDTATNPDNGEFDSAVADFSDALAEDLEWEEADVQVDESSFVILPEDPYQPSAFLDMAADQTARSGPAAGNKPPPAASAGHTSDTAAAIPTHTDSASNSGRADNPEYKFIDTAGGAKDVIRSHVMATELDEQDESLEQLSAENLRAVRDVDTALELGQHKPARSSRAGAIAAGALLLTVIGSLIFFSVRMPELSQDPRFRPWYQTACNLLGCELPDYLNPAQLETSNLVVRSHPQQDNALELTAVFRNAAQFPQPFPVIELTFSDPSNSTLMVFEFLPDEYLPQALRGMPLMPAGAPVQITLDLADPGPEAVNYQMTFKAAPPRPR
jgi:predicted Zn finger-like uncharacterized protein